MHKILTGVCLSLALITLAPGHSSAQTSSVSSITLPGSPAPVAKTCVQVEIGGQKPSAYNCLNQELKQQVQAAAPTQNTPPLSASSASNQVGTFNEQGVAEQYGQNFGKSVIPYRPPTPVYGGGLHP